MQFTLLQIIWNRSEDKWSMLGHQSCNQAVITHSPHSHNISQMRWSHPKYEVQCCDDPLRSGPRQGSPDNAGAANDNQPRLCIDQSEARTASYSCVWDDVWRQCHGCRGPGPNKCEAPLASINIGAGTFHKHADSGKTQSFIPTIFLRLSARMFLFLSRALCGD